MEVSSVALIYLFSLIYHLLFTIFLTVLNHLWDYSVRDQSINHVCIMLWFGVLNGRIDPLPCNIFGAHNDELFFQFIYILSQ